ncbi:FMN-linked oxidoreductase [Aspergillus udagawae]|uniref:FMN-linked oxidoreductase n=1 Tax=Aspergillus udagawae TaxID=91492 RepID=A0A8H3SBL7_9EURO|nr:FMN-linked oxidoreductase [Aspergillus udagawae]
MSHLNIAQPLTLACGLTLPNRLVKAAIAEGNVQIDADHLGGPGDFAINTRLPEARVLAAFRAWASVCQRYDTKAIVQLCHPGRQIAFSKGTIAPSTVPMDLGDALVPRLLNALVFGIPREMTTQQVHDTVRRFAEGARVIAAAGFAGVELHAANGYLLTQFLSGKSNLGADAYGGSPAARARSHHCRNYSGDPRHGARRVLCGDQGERRELRGSDVQHGIGQAEKASTLAREAFCIDFAEAVRAELPGTPLLLTGGFRSRGRVQPALKEGVCDLVGLARPSVLDPMLPRTVLLNQDASDKDAVMYAKRIPGSTLTERLGVKLLGVGLERDWYTERLHWIGAIKTTIMVTGTAFPLGTAIVRSMLRRPDLVKNTYGLYATAHGAEKLANVRKTAEGINRRVAIGSLPPIQALVLHEKDDVMPFLLSLLLLQSIDQDRGRIVVVGNRTRRMDALGSFTDKTAATKLSDTMLWCELSARLAVDPALSNISVAVVDQAWQPAHWFEQTLLAQILVWLVATVAILLWPDAPTRMTRRSAEEVVRVLADDRNGVWVSGWVVSKSDVDVKATERSVVQLPGEGQGYPGRHDFNTMAQNKKE